MGSVSEGLVHNARCPVLVLRGEEDAWPPSRVLMADDSSEDARRAAELAAAMGGLFGARGSLVQVYPRLEGRRAGGSLEARMVEHALKGAEAELSLRAEALEGLLNSRPDVRLVADEGADGIDGIALTLMNEARETGDPTLISVGSRGLGRVQRARLGSVSTKVVRAAEGPVLFHPQAPSPRHPPSGKAAGATKPGTGRPSGTPCPTTATAPAGRSGSSTTSSTAWATALACATSPRRSTSGALPRPRR